MKEKGISWGTYNKSLYIITMLIGKFSLAPVQKQIVINKGKISVRNVLDIHF